jgi:hypothetical protein
MQMSCDAIDISNLNFYLMREMLCFGCNFNGITNSVDWRKTFCWISGFTMLGSHISKHSQTPRLARLGFRVARLLLQQKMSGDSEAMTNQLFQGMSILSTFCWFPSSLNFFESLLKCLEDLWSQKTLKWRKRPCRNRKRSLNSDPAYKNRTNHVFGGLPGQVDP